LGVLLLDNEEFEVVIMIAVETLVEHERCRGLFSNRAGSDPYFLRLSTIEQFSVLKKSHHAVKTLHYVGVKTGN
jgi:hypothetical protein